jgi:hypothetical protein
LNGIRDVTSYRTSPLRPVLKSRVEVAVALRSSAAWPKLGHSVFETFFFSTGISETVPCFFATGSGNASRY